MSYSRAIQPISGLCVVALCTIAAPAAQSQASGSVIEYPNPEAVRSLPTSAMRLDIGGPDGVEFYQIAAILPRHNAGFVVVNAGTSELRFFDASGRLLSNVGRSGAGPGEYSYIQDAALLPGDSIVVLDVSPAARRISVLDPQGTFVRSFMLVAPFGGGGFPTGMVALRNGTLLIGYSEVERMAPQRTAVYFGQRLFQYSTTGQLHSSEALRLPEREHFVQGVPPAMGGVAYWDLAFGRRFTVRADSNWILVGDGTTWAIEQRTVGGVVVKTHRLQRSLRPVTAQDRDAFRAEAVEGTPPNRRAVAERMAADMPYPKTKPAYRRFERDEVGLLWLEAYPERGETRATWIRLDPRTRRAVAVQLPPRFRALAFTPDLVYGVWRDSDDVEHVQVLALEGLR